MSALEKTVTQINRGNNSDTALVGCHGDGTFVRWRHQRPVHVVGVLHYYGGAVSHAGK